ncbi:MAG: KilA-N domain-containing protein [Bacteroidales bacterium]|nr:KilA-N domain-containing protein [Bacteroidales bacterium]
MSKKYTKITVLENSITITPNDFISLTDMLKSKDGDFFISDWLRNRNTVEYLGIWERINNPDFNYGEYAIIRNQAGLNNYKISVKEFQIKSELEKRLDHYFYSHEFNEHEKTLIKFHEILKSLNNEYDFRDYKENGTPYLKEANKEIENILLN